MTDSPEIGVVIPTLGKRPDWLGDAIASLRDAEVHTILVAPEGAFIDPNLVQHIIWREKHGDDVAGSINAGVSAMPASVKFVTWLNDDDVLMPGALKYGHETLNSALESPFVYGCCTYVDVSSHQLWRNRFGRIANFLLPFGPDLIPQPASLIRRSEWQLLNGLDERLHLAFDLDLFLRLRRLGRPVFDRRIESLVRWHPDAKSNRSRLHQVREAEHVRLMNNRGISRLITRWFAPLVRRAVLKAPRILLERR